MVLRLVALVLLMAVAACGDINRDLEAPVDPLGDFRLGFSEVVAPNIQKLLVSREATAEEWTTLLDAAMERRFDRFEGSQFYHLGISIEGYSLPPPIIPGKSYLAIRVTVWKDETQTKLNPEPELILNAQIFESRITTNRDDTMQRLVDGTAKLVEDWLRKQQAEEGWFAGPTADIPSEAPAEETADSNAS